MINFPILSNKKAKNLNSIGRAIGPSNALILYEIAISKNNPVIILAENTQHAEQLKDEITFFNKDDCPIDLFPEWETLPYDSFSPHQDIVSQRLETLYQLTQNEHRVFIVPVNTLMMRMAPVDYIGKYLLILKNEQR